MLIYEVYVDKFTGDFKGLAAKLRYLKNLGIEAIWLLPFYPSPMIDDGYDVSDFMQVRPELGTLEDFKQFATQAKNAGIKVIVDLVLNHVSTHHPWFKEKKDYFLWSKTGKEFAKAPNPFLNIKPSNWIYHSETGEYYFATFYPEQADLNWDNPAVFEEMTRIMDFWANLGVDGFRLDAVRFLIKREGTGCVHLPETHKIIKKLRAYNAAHHPEVLLIGEATGSVLQMRKYFGTGDECHMMFHFQIVPALFKALRGDRHTLDHLLATSFDIPKNCEWVSFLRNHDYDLLDRGQRPRKIARRLAELCGNDKEKILQAFKLLRDLPGSHVMYYGDEIGMQNEKIDPPPSDTRRYVRGTFDWQEAHKQIADPDSLLNKVIEIMKNR